MAFIGYSESGHNELQAEITARKNKTLGVLETFSDIQTSISEAWKGSDADKYKESLKTYITNTRETISETFDEMSSYFRKTYNDWVAKQNSEGQQ